MLNPETKTRLVHAVDTGLLRRRYHEHHVEMKLDDLVALLRLVEATQTGTPAGSVCVKNGKAVTTMYHPDKLPQFGTFPVYLAQREESPEREAAIALGSHYGAVLRQIAQALGMPATADVTKDLLPKIERMRDIIRKTKADIHAVRQEVEAVQAAEKPHLIEKGLQAVGLWPWNPDTDAAIRRRSPEDIARVKSGREPSTLDPAVARAAADLEQAVRDYDPSAGFKTQEAPADEAIYRDGKLCFTADEVRRDREKREALAKQEAPGFSADEMQREREWREARMRKEQAETALLETALTRFCGPAHGGYPGQVVSGKPVTDPAPESASTRSFWVKG